MAPTLTGFVLLPLVLVLALMRPLRLFHLAVVLVPFSATAAINVTSVGYGLRASLFCFIVYGVVAVLAARLRLRPVAEQYLPLAGLVGTVVVLFVSLVPPALTNDLTSFSINQGAYYIAGLAVTFLVYMTVVDAARLAGTLKALFIGALLFTILGWYQYAAFHLGLHYPAEFFNNSASEAALLFDQEIKRLGVKRLTSAAVEPSLLAQSMIIVIGIGTSLMISGVRGFGPLLAITTLLAVSCVFMATSTTGYFGLAVIAGLLVVQRPGPGLAAIATGLLILAAAMIAYDPLADALYHMTIGKVGSFSYENRVGSMVRAWELFLDAPLLGHGWATTGVFNIALTYLSQMGLIGFAAMLVFIVSTLAMGMTLRRRLGRALTLSRAVGPTADRARVLVALLRALETGFIASIAMQVVAGSTYTFMDFWVLSGLFVAAIGIARTHLDALTAAVERPAPETAPSAAPMPGGAVQPA